MNQAIIEETNERPQPPAGLDSTRERLERLSDTWLRLARRKIRDAELEKDAMGARLIRHGGFCYFNCAMDIKRMLAASEGRIETLKDDNVTGNETRHCREHAVTGESGGKRLNSIIDLTGGGKFL